MVAVVMLLTVVLVLWVTLLVIGDVALAVLTVSAFVFWLDVEFTLWSGVGCGNVDCVVVVSFLLLGSPAMSGEDVSEVPG